MDDIQGDWLTIHQIFQALETDFMTLKEAEKAVSSHERKAVLEGKIEEVKKFATAKIDHRGSPAPFNPNGLPISTPATEEMTKLVNQAALERISQLEKEKL